MGYYEFKKAAAKCHRHAVQHDKAILWRKLKEKEAKAKAEKEVAHKAALQNFGKPLPEAIEVTEASLDKIKKRLYFNEDFADHFVRLADETGDNDFYKKAYSIRNCHKHWFGDWYSMQRTFDKKALSLCHSRFCSNCMHLKQATLLKRYDPIFEAFQKDYDLYHFVVTVPNCKGYELKKCVKRLCKIQGQIYKYFDCRAGRSIAGLNFAQYGYYGAVRSLEIVVNESDYHIHLHNIVVLKKGLIFAKQHINVFSYSRHSDIVRKFSDLEILLQKIVYLAFNGKKVTLKAINELELGYSCIFDKIDGTEWREAFKYVTKLTKDTMTALSYEQFKPLYYALQGTHVVQGYGKLYNVVKDDNTIDDEVSSLYAEYIARLQLIENPVEHYFEFDDLHDSVKKGQMKVISKYIIQQWLNEEARENKDE